VADPAAPGAVVPYRPSWFDRFTAWIERLPGPAALWYLLAAGLAVLFTVLEWIIGLVPSAGDALYHLVFVATPIYTLAVLHGLDYVAGQALDEFRPVLAADAATTARLRYQLTTLPARPALLVTLISPVGPVLIWGQLAWMQALLIHQGLLLLITLLEAAIVVITWVFAGLFIYHAIHQLRLVTTIYARYTRINLFTLGPLYAFSRLTALTAAAPLAVFVPDHLGWMAYGRPTIAPGTIALWVLFGLLSVATFVLPLWGVHRLLAQEKMQAQLTLAGRLQAVLADLHRQQESGAPTPDATSATKNLLDSLLTEQALLNRVSTWPWAPETPRALATALLLPVVVLILSEIVKRVFGF
jgi:hypothetical protein